MIVQIEFEATDDVTADQFHELLCLTILERSESALNELYRYVTDIRDMSDPLHQPQLGTDDPHGQ